MEANKTLLRMKFARVIGTYADMEDIDREEAMRRFYASSTYQLICEGVADMHCRSDIYLAEELKRELT